MNFELEKDKFLLDWEYKNYLKYKDIRSLLNIARKYHLPIDFDRVDDYDISISFTDSLEVKMLDKKNNITYYSVGKNNKKKQLGYNIEVLEVTDEYRHKTIYNSRDNSPKSEEFIVYDNGKYVKFIKKYDEKNVSLDINCSDGFKYSISSDKEDSIIRNYQRKKISCEDNYIFTSPNNLVYSVNTQSNDCFVKGMCFTKDNIPNMLSDKLKFTDFCNMFFPDCFLTSADSYISFHGISNFGVGYLEMTKKDGVISVMYQNDKVDKGLETDTFELKGEKGVVNNEDIDNVIEYLKNKYDDEIVPFFCDNLEAYGKHLDSYNNGCNNYDDMLLDNCFQLSISNIKEWILNNKRYFFELLNNKFYNQNNLEKDSTRKVLKRNC